MRADEAAALARRIEPSDPAQRAILESTLIASGEEYVVSVREVPNGRPRWQGFNVASGNAICFMGTFIYGGDTLEEACEDVRRIASKWDWTFIAPREVSG